VEGPGPPEIKVESLGPCSTPRFRQLW